MPVPDHAPKLMEIFSEAVELTSAVERTACLDRVCGADPELRRRVEALLRAHDSPDSVLDRPFVDSFPGAALRPEPTDPATAPTMAVVPDAGHPSASDTEPATATATAHDPGARPMAESPGAWIGWYKLLRSIGEVGMGVVYEAEQTRPVHRTVALKIIKPGMDTDAVVARFETEKQALALMDHPNIAKVHD
ncbi:MAG TPA: hypothetical protein VGH33_17470, partial [Isosphaeraceae bacterium]